MGFVGWMSRFLNEMLEDAGIARAECLLTNVFNIRYDGKTEIFCGPKESAITGYGPLTKGYVQVEIQRPIGIDENGETTYRSYNLIEELNRLIEELLEADPNIIIAMGNAALWAFSGHAAISKHRGTTFISTHTVTGYKVLGTFHPAAVAHQYSLRPTVVMDLMKAARESSFPEIRRPSVSVHIPETIEDLYDFSRLHILGCQTLAVDIETVGQQITCIGFAPSIDHALVVPIFDRRRKGRSYWPDQQSERQAWGFIRELLLDRAISKTFQNGMYDIAFLWRSYGLKVFGCEHDTMLLSHALQPESLKGLGYLGSIFTDHGSWKQMREKVTTIKRDE